MKSRTLSVLEKGQIAVVDRISEEIKGPQRRRLLDLGVIPGANISHRLDGPSGDPRAYEIAGSVIALRKEQTDQIFIQQKRV